MDAARSTATDATLARPWAISVSLRTRLGP